MQLKAIPWINASLSLSRLLDDTSGKFNDIQKYLSQTYVKNIVRGVLGSEPNV